MNLLLDTHALLWWLEENPTLSANARAAILNPKSIVYVSVATAWEMSIKIASGKLTLSYPHGLERLFAENQLQVLPIELRHAIAAAELPKHHNDPFDRMLIAQAQLESLTLVTRDRALGAYGVLILEA